jgi:hypothetical protein
LGLEPKAADLKDQRSTLELYTLYKKSFCII